MWSRISVTPRWQQWVGPHVRAAVALPEQTFPTPYLPASHPRPLGPAGLANTISPVGEIPIFPNLTLPLSQLCVGARGPIDWAIVDQAMAAYGKETRTCNSLVPACSLMSGEVLSVRHQIWLLRWGLCPQKTPVQHRRKEGWEGEGGIEWTRSWFEKKPTRGFEIASCLLRTTHRLVNYQGFL